MRLPRAENLSHLASTQVPAEAFRDFWYRSSSSTLRNGLMPPEFDFYLALEQDEGCATYVAHHTKVMDAYRTHPRIGEVTYFTDVDTNGQRIGSGELKRMTDDVAIRSGKSKPYVGWTETNNDLRNSGLGRQRLLTMNAASLLIHNLPIHSGIIMYDPAAEHIWDRLVTEGLAMEYTEFNNLSSEGHSRYSFLA